jgi:hypothetical protein
MLKPDHEHGIGHLVQLFTMALLCLGLLLFSSSLVSLIATFPFSAFVYFLALELHFLLTKDEP